MNRSTSLYKRLRSEGICTRCRKADAGGMFACYDCRMKQADSLRRIYKRRVEQGLCGRCGKVPAVEGFRRCVDCREESKKPVEVIKREVWDVRQ